MVEGIAMAKKKINTDLLSDIEIYEMVLEGKLKKFPLRFWTDSGVLQTSRDLTKYLIEKRLKWHDEDIRQNLSQKTFIDNKLNGMLQRVFDGSPYLALDNAYPGKFKEWELNFVPLEFWTEEKCYEAVRWLIEKKLELSKEEIKKQYSKELLVRNGLVTVTRRLRNKSAYEIIDELYPGEFKPWEFVLTPVKFWNNKTITAAIKWLIEEKLQWDKEEVKKKFTVETIENNGLSGLVIYMNKNHIGIFDLIDMVYPGVYKEWDLVKVNKWTREKSIKATKWLIEEKLKWDTKEIKQKININVFYRHGLAGMLSHVYRSSPHLALKDAYPKENWETLKTKFNKKD